MDLTVIDETDDGGGFDAAGFFGALTTLDEVPMVSVASMVRNVLAASKWQKIRCLRVVDHGSVKEAKGSKGKAAARCRLQFGNDRVDVANFSQHAPEFEKLVEKFYAPSFVHLAHCYAGQDHDLLRRFAKTFDVPVYAGTGMRAQWSRTQFGSLKVCYPDGRVRSVTDLPC